MLMMDGNRALSGKYVFQFHANKDMLVYRVPYTVYRVWLVVLLSRRTKSRLCLGLTRRGGCTVRTLRRDGEIFPVGFSRVNNNNTENNAVGR